MNLHNIHTVSRYEAKLLRRSWLFRIFAILSLLVITFFHLTTQANLFWYQWNMVAMSSSIPFVNIYIFNIAQSVIAIFLAGSFLKRDQKLDTAEVIYVRPMSNADYVIGKSWGIIKVFISLNILALLVAAFINLYVSESPFNLLPYVFYLLTLSIPSLVFILGLSFMVMCFVKNQAVTFVILLGYIGVTLFYLGNIEHGAFDFFALTLPNIFSDISGHPVLSDYLLQRSSFLLLGISLLSFTIALVKRLPHHPKKRILLNTLGIIILLLGIGANLSYLWQFRHNDTLRSRYIEKYQAYNSHDKVNLLSEELIYSQKGNQIFVDAHLTVQNRNHRKINSVLIYLNPTLQVTEVSHEGTKLLFKRDEQILVIDKELTPYQIVDLQIRYEGKVSENIGYLEVQDEEYYDTQTGSSILRFGKRYAFVQNDFTLLTPEVLWYPVTFPPMNPEAPYNIQKNFTHFSLKVIPTEKQTVLSQGTSSQSGDTIIFHNTHRLPSISLAIGNYEKKSITVDSVLFELYHFKGHDYFSKEFTNLKDTLGSIISDIKNQYESRKNRVYPFEKLILAETPVSFASYVRNWKGYSEFIQPEIAFIPERGTILPSGNFKLAKKMQRQRGGGPNRGTIDETEIETRVLRDFITWCFLNESKYEETGNLFVNSIFSSGWNGTSKLNPFDFSGFYFNHANFIYSHNFPVMDILLNTMFKQEENDPWSRWRRRFSGMSDAQKASAFLKEKSFEQAVLDRSLSPEVFYEMLKLKGNYLRNYLTSQIPLADYNKFMTQFMKDYQFKEINFTVLNNSFMRKFNINLMDFIPQWYTINQTPLFIVKGINADKVVVDDYTKYVVQFKIHNPTEVEGIVSVNIEEGEWGRRGRGRQQEKPLQHYIIPAKSYKEIKTLCDERPRNIDINTNIAQNIPSDIVYNFSKINTETKEMTTGMFNTDATLFEYNPKDIIVDNEDQNFHLIESNQKTTLQSIFKKPQEDKYKNLTTWMPPTRWTATVGTNFYGEYINSGYYKKTGNGNNKAEWVAQIETPGFYEVFVYNARIVWGWRREESNMQYYTVKHDDGEEEVSIETNENTQDWVSLGSFHFSPGEAKVILSDKGSNPNQVIYADAVRWVFQNKEK